MGGKVKALSKKKVIGAVLLLLLIALAVAAKKFEYIVGGFFEETGEASPFRKKAMYFTSLPGGKVRCDLCPHNCVLGQQEKGKCKARFNKDGELWSLIYGKTYPLVTPPNYQMPLTFLGLKRPWVKMGLVGCNLDCPFCVFGQFVLSDPEKVPIKYLSPEYIVDLARRKNASVIVHGTNEPTVNFEYTLAVSKLAREAGLINVVTTNGFVNSEPLLELSRHVDAVVFGLKGFSEEVYNRYTGGSLKPVLDNAMLMKKQGVFVSFFYLMIPSVSDSEEQVRNMARWVKAKMGALTEVYLMRYYPSYRLKNLPPTPMATLKRARAIAEEEGLKMATIYLMNIHDDDDPMDLLATSVNCPFCGEMVLGFRLKDGAPAFEAALDGNKCKHCGRDIPWSRKRSFEMEARP